MTTTPGGVPYPPLTNAPNVPADMQAMAVALDSRVVGSFASAAARTAAYTSSTNPPAPSDGQMSYRTDTHTYERYAGPTSQFTQFIGARVQMKHVSAVQAIPTGAITAVSFNQTDYNSLGWTVSTSGVTIPFACWVDVAFLGEFAGNATGRRFACILRNGAEATEVNRFTAPVNTAANGTAMPLPGLSINCAAGDVIGIGVFQDSGVSLNLSVGACLRIALSI